jgi:threonine/homoserine/homoserine lactone efflux protein
MFFASDLGTVAHGIQMAVAPVFLLTAVAAMIGSVAGRLARIIDRARLLEARIDASPHDDPMTAAYAELRQLRTRGRLVNVCLALLTLCAILIGLTIMALFVGETTETQIFRVATVLFLSGVICFLLALVCFLAETLIASRILRFRRASHTAASKQPTQ